MRGIRLGVLIPLNTPFVTCEWALNLRRLRLPPRTEFWTFRSPVPIDKARTRLVRDALDHGCTEIWFIDSDVVVPPNAYELLHQHRYPIASGVYVDKGGRGNAWKDGKNYWVEKGAIVVDEVGLGCCLIDCRVFKQIPENGWFIYEYDGTDESKPSEDIHFCRVAKKYGFGVLVVGGVKCRHVFTGAMTEPTKIEHLVV